MKKGLLGIVIFLFVVIHVSCNFKKRKQAKALNGYIDLRNWNFEKKGVIDLDGEWEFYWEQLLNPEDFAEKNKLNLEYIYVPDGWAVQKSGRKSYPEFGFATYRLILLLPDKRTDYQFRFYLGVSCSSKAWVNGIPYFERGIVSARKEKSVPEYTFDLVLPKDIPIKDSKIELILQVSDHFHGGAYGGIHKSVWFGRTEQIYNVNKLHRIISSAFLGILILIAIYHLIIFFFRTTDYSYLIFAILSILIACRIVYTSGSFYEFFTYSTYRKIGFFPYFLFPALVPLFFYFSYREEISKKMIYIAIAIAILATPIVLIGSVATLVDLEPLAFLYSPAVLVYLLVFPLFKALKNRKKGIVLVYILLVLLLLTFLYDILYSQSLVSGIGFYLSEYVFSLFIISQVINLAYSLSDSLKSNQVLNQVLDLQNKNLEKTVSNRTLELKERNEELNATINRLKQTQAELIQSEKMASLGQLIAGIAHEINTPLGAINASIGAIIDANKKSLKHLPELVKKLKDEELVLFLDMVNQSMESSLAITSKEERAHRRKIIVDFESKNINRAEEFADMLVDMGIYESYDKYIPVLNKENLSAAYYLCQQMKNSRNIKTAVGRASKIVFALKSYARYGQSEETVMANVPETIETVLTLYHNQLKNGIEIIKDFEKVPMIKCYPDELSQVWTNIIHNSIQAIQEEGVLSISIAQIGNNLVIKIIDTGKGIPPYQLPKIFEAFYTTKPAGEGSGLGLYIVKQIIDKHNGNINIESEVEEGTKVVIELPIVN